MSQDQPPEDNVQWETPERRRARRLDEETEDVGFPIIWVLIGGLAALLTIGLVALGLVRIFTRPSTTAATTPTVLASTVVPTTAVTVTALVVEKQTEAPPTAVPTKKPTEAPTPTPLPPTSTPAPPTPEPAAATELKVGGYARIINTDGKGLSLRGGPGRDNARLVVAAADSVLPIVAGPKDDEGGDTDDAGGIYQWWQLRNTDGTEGWGRADFLEPAPAP
jgi:hypothetical protein